MNFNTNDNPLLVAPRPIRLAAQTFLQRTQPIRLMSTTPDTNLERLEDLKLGLITSSPVGEKENASPRASPRSALPSEALEEFLSILTPSFLPPHSPILRARRQVASLPSFAQDCHAYSFMSRGRIEAMQPTSDAIEESEAARSGAGSRNAARTPIEFEVADHDDPPFRWFSSSVLSSPVNRTNTRNPFQRHPSYTYPTPQSPAQLPVTPLSPTAVPLPSPTPDELCEVP